MHVRLLRIFALITFITLSALCVTMPAHADTDGGCDPKGTPYYNGSLLLDKGTYDVYVKLGKVGQTAAASGYVQSADGNSCTTIGAVEASGNEWRKIGSYNQSGDETSVTFQLASSVLVDVPNANRPSLMLVSRENPVCEPTTECVATIAGQKAYIRPSGNNLESTALHIVRASSVDLSHVTKVQYYADDEMLYETKTLEDFSSDDIPYYATKLVRVLYYDSGQTAVIESSPPENTRYNPWSVLRQFAKKYSSLLTVVGIFVAAVIITRLVSLFDTYLRRRHRWRADHGFIHEEADLAVTPELKRRLILHNKIRSAYRYTERTIVVVASVAGIVFVVNAFLMQIGTVSGFSMWSTLNDGQKIVINKVPIALAQIGKLQYVPKRGTIVVVSPNFGTVDTNSREEADSLIIKRVIGLPGERVVADGGSLKVYNTEHPNGFNPDASSSWESHVQSDTSTDHIDVTLSENEIFIAGDNRPVSIDSRFNGPISTSQILGVVSWY